MKKNDDQQTEDDKKRMPQSSLAFEHIFPTPDRSGYHGEALCMGCCAVVKAKSRTDAAKKRNAARTNF